MHSRLCRQSWQRRTRRISVQTCYIGYDPWMYLHIHIDEWMNEWMFACQNVMHSTIMISHIHILNGIYAQNWNWSISAIAFHHHHCILMCIGVFITPHGSMALGLRWRWMSCRAQTLLFVTSATFQLVLISMNYSDYAVPDELTARQMIII